MSKTLNKNSEANKILPRAQWPKGVRCPFKRVTKRVVTYGVNILGKHLLETRQSDGIIIIILLDTAILVALFKSGTLHNPIIV